MMQKRVLLSLVEAVNFIDKKDRLLAVNFPLTLSLGNDSTDLFDAGQNR